MALQHDRLSDPLGLQRNPKDAPSESVNQEIWSFGDYRLDARERRLWHAGECVSLPPKAFDLLLVLVQHAGQLVEKDYLLKTVWPDSFVEEANISVYISAIRKAFGKHPPGSEFIETIPKWGYRFTAMVTRHPSTLSTLLVSDSVEAPFFAEIQVHSPQFSPVPPAEPSSLPRSVAQTRIRTRIPRSLLFSLVALCALLLLLLVVWKFPGKTNGSNANTRPLVGEPGFFSQPAFSADGQRIAYCWRSNSDPYQSIYIQGVNADHPIRLTDTGGDDFSPVWSPNPPEIAFMHYSGDLLEIVIVNTQAPALRRKLTTISGVHSSFRIPPSLAWSPDGRTLLTTDINKPGESPSLTLISVDSGSKQPMTHAPLHMVDDNGAFSPDGTMVAFRRQIGDSSDEVYVIPRAGGVERRLSFESGPIDGLTWSPDGRSILLSSGRATSMGNIWRVPLYGGRAVAVTTPLAHTSTPAVSAAAHRLAYVDSPNNESIWRVPIGAATQGEQFISSNFYDSSPRYSPDGNFVAFRSDRSGANEIWICRSNGKEAQRLTRFNGPVTGSPQWSPDSKSLAFDSRGTGHADIYIVNIGGGTPTRITNSSANNSDSLVPNWSRDGRAIYYSSNRTGQWQVWRKSLDTGTDTQMTTTGGFNGTESEDGATLYFVHDVNKTDLWRSSLRSGKAEPVVQNLDPGMWNCWTIQKNSLYYMKRRRSIGEPADIFRMDLATGNTEIIGHAQSLTNGGLSISPDGRWVLVAQINGNRNSTIMITDGWE